MNSYTASSTSYVNTLMVHYCLDLDGRSARFWINQWLDAYSIDWITLAVIEALYLGRYKAVSVEQILRNWKRRGHPSPHFSKEFERVISRRFPRNLRELAVRRTELVTPPISQAMSDGLEPEDPTIRAILQQYLEQQTSISYDLKASSLQGFISEPVNSSEPVISLESPQQREAIEDIGEPDEKVAQTVQPQSRPLSRWLANSKTFQVPLLEAEPIDQFVPEPIQSTVMDRLKAISKARFARGSTFALIESLMEQPL